MSKLIVFATVSVSVFAFVIISLSTHSYAAGSTVTPRQNQVVSELQSKRCERIGTFIDNRIQSYNENKDRHILNHQRVLEKISTLITNLKAKGLDVTKLSSDFEILNAMTKSFALKYTNFIGQLTEAKQLGCGESEGAFKAKMTESRASLKLAREEAQSIWNYINTVIRKDLNDLRTEANKLNSTDNI